MLYCYPYYNYTHCFNQSETLKYLCKSFVVKMTGSFAETEIHADVDVPSHSNDTARFANELQYSTSNGLFSSDQQNL